MFESRECDRPARVLFCLWAGAYAAMVAGLLSLPLLTGQIW